MPSRMLRDWTLSRKIRLLTVHSERFFTRLIMKVDDYGCFYADPCVLKATLFPYLLDSIREADLIRWMAECQKAGLIVIYESDNEKYLQIVEFGQRLRQQTLKYPLPNPDGKLPQVADIPPPEQNRTELEDEGEVKSGEPPPPTDEEKSFLLFQEFIEKSAANVGKMKEPFTLEQFLKLKESFTPIQVSELLKKMHNHKPLLTKNISSYLTFLNWSKNEFNKEAKVVPITSGPSPQELQAQQILKEINSGK